MQQGPSARNIVAEPLTPRGTTNRLRLGYTYYIYKTSIPLRVKRRGMLIIFRMNGQSG